MGLFYLLCVTRRPYFGGPVTSDDEEGWRVLLLSGLAAVKAPGSLGVLVCEAHTSSCGEDSLVAREHVYSINIPRDKLGQKEEMNLASS